MKFVVDDQPVGHLTPDRARRLVAFPAFQQHGDGLTLVCAASDRTAVMAQVVAWVNYIAPVKGTKEELLKLDASLGDNELIVPTPELLARAQVFRGLSPAEETKYSKAYADITAG